MVSVAGKDRRAEGSAGGSGLRYHSGKGDACKWYMAIIDDEGNLSTGQWFKLFSIDLDLDHEANYVDGWGHCVPDDSLKEILDNTFSARDFPDMHIVIRIDDTPVSGITLLRGLVDRYQDDIIYLGVIGRMPEHDPKWFEYQVAWSASGAKGLRR